MVELKKKSISCFQDNGEADGLIAEVAMQDESNLQKIIVAEDVDIFVISTARDIVDRLEKEIYFLELGKQNAPSVIYSSKSFEIGYPNSAKLIAFTHAFTGCDTVFAFYSMGKKKFLDPMEKRADMKEQAEIFYNTSAEITEIFQVGRYCAILMYVTAKDVKQSK